jgi:hypothetical protein
MRARPIIGKLGCQEAILDPRTIDVRDFCSISQMPSRPAARDWGIIARTGEELVYPVLANDRYGDCVKVMCCHQIGVWTGQAGEQQQISDAEALDAYRRFDGFDPARPETDVGSSLLYTLKKWRSEHIAGRTIKAFVSVPLNDEAMLFAAAEFFGGLMMSWSLPLAWQEAEEWTTGPGLSGVWAPASWGRHATLSPLYSPMGITVASWGSIIPVSLRALHVYGREAFVAIPEQLWAVLTGDRCPAGVDGAKLAALLQQVSA